MRKAFAIIELSIALIISFVVVLSIINGSNAIYKKIQTIGSNPKGNTEEAVNILPATISNLRLWLDAQNVNSFAEEERSYGSSISKWQGLNPADPSQVQADFTQSNQSYKPLYAENGINNLPSLFFDGVNDYLKSYNPDNDIYSTNDGITIFIVVEPHSTTNDSKFVFDFGFVGNTGYGIYMNGLETFCYSPLNYGGVAVRQLYDSFEKGTIASCNIKFQDKISLYVDGQLIDSSSISLSKITSDEITEYYNMTVGYVAKGGNSTRFFQGYIGEIIIYDRSLTTSEQQSVEQYLSQKWGIN